MDIALGCNFLYGEQNSKVTVGKARGFVMDSTVMIDVPLITNDRGRTQDQER